MMPAKPHAIRLRRWIPDLPRAVWLLLLGDMLATIPVGFSLVAIPIYLSRIGFSAGTSGLLLSLAGLAPAAVMIPFSILADRRGRRPFVLAGLALPVPAFLLLAVTDHPALVALAGMAGAFGMFRGVGGAASIPSQWALLADHAGPTGRTRAFAVGEIAFSGGIALGSLLAAAPSWISGPAGVSIMTGYRWMFVAAAGCAAAAALVVSLVPPVPAGASELPRDPAGAGSDPPASPAASTAQATPARGRRAARGWWPYRSGRVIGWLALFRSMLGLSTSFVTELMPLWFLLRFGVGEAVLGPWYSAGAVLSLLVVPLIPLTARRLGLGNGMLAVAGLGGLFLAAMPLSAGYQLAALWMLARYMVNGVYWALLGSYTTGVVAAADRAAASGISTAAQVFAGALAPVASGYMLQRGWYSAPFVAAIVALAIGLAVFQLRLRGVRPPEEEPAGGP